MMRSLFVKIVLCVVIMEGLGGLGAAVTSGGMSDWYQSLERPPGTPPGFVFGIVWPILYAMIGASFAVMWHRIPEFPGRNKATTFFAIQLILNLIWSPIFFGAHQTTLALIVILAMWVAIALTIRSFAPQSKLAAFLLVPYLVWVSYATYLNAGFVLLNE